MMQDKKQIAKGELVFTSFLFLAGIVVLFDAGQIPEDVGANYVSNKAFPSIIGWLLLVLAGIQLIRVIMGDRGEAEEIEGGVADKKLHLKPFALVFGGLLFFAFFAKILGFIISATVLFTAVVYALKTKKSPWFKVVPIALALSLVIYFGFTQGLQVNLPWGFDFSFNTGEVVVEEEW
ncbi:MAG: hypothetical protein RI933_353 [Actinomycetota bacterium]|jgi:putative tricarboxylic transport membrane protein